MQVQLETNHNEAFPIHTRKHDILYFEEQNHAEKASVHIHGCGHCLKVVLQ